MFRSPSPWSQRRRGRWFRIGVNLVMIFIGLELIEYAYATQNSFSVYRIENDVSVLKAMYIAFIAGLLPNYASTIAEELADLNLRSLREIAAVALFLSITFLLNVAVIYLSLVYI
jgi:hypothetical protein